MKLEMFNEWAANCPCHEDGDCVQLPFWSSGDRLLNECTYKSCPHVHWSRVKANKSPDCFDDLDAEALNDACWKFVSKYRHKFDDPMTAELFNSLKPILAEALITYLGKVKP